jgi:tetratricopeptide (TPR) repeat protein
MAVWEKLKPVFFLAEDTPFFPIDAYDDRRRRFVARAGALAVLAFVAHLPGLGAGWIWTDEAVIPGDPLIHSFGGLLTTWLHPGLASAAPLPFASTILYFQFLLSSGPHLYHLVSLLFHIAGAIALWLVLRRLQVPGAWLAAALFAVHPVEVQSVAWASRQSQTLACLLALLSVLFYLRMAEIRPPLPADFEIPPLPRWLWGASLACYLLAVLSNPSTILLPVVILLLIWWKRGRIDRGDWIKLTPFLAICVAAIAVGLYFSESRHLGGTAAGLPLIDRVLVTGRAVWFYIFSIFWPIHLPFLYPRWSINDGWWMAIFLAALLVVLAVLIYQKKRLGKWPLVALLIYLALLLPATPLFRSQWTVFSFVSDQSQYLAGTVLLTLIAAGIVHLLDRIRLPAGAAVDRETIRFAVPLLLIGALGALCLMQSTLYRNERRLWMASIDYAPRSLIARGELANFYLRSGDLVRADDQFGPDVMTAINRRLALGGPDAAGMIAPMFARGAILGRQGRFSEAAQLYQKILQLDSQSREAETHLADAYRHRGDITKALASYADAIQRYPNDETLQDGYGSALLADGRLDDAIDRFEAAIRINPNFIPARLNLANALFYENRLSESAAQLQKALQIDPRSFDAYMHAAAILAKLHDYARAERMLKAAVQLHPDSAEARNDLGIALAAQGYFGEAVESFEKAVKLQPGFEEARQNLQRAEVDAARQHPTTSVFP